MINHTNYKWNICYINFRYDEVFDMVLPEDTDLNTTYILFTVKDKCLVGEGMFLGEALLPLKNVQRNNSSIRLQVILDC